MHIVSNNIYNVNNMLHLNYKEILSVVLLCHSNNSKICKKRLIKILIL